MNTKKRASIKQKIYDHARCLCIHAQGHPRGVQYANTGKKLHTPHCTAWTQNARGHTPMQTVCKTGVRTPYIGGMTQGTLYPCSDDEKNRPRIMSVTQRGLFLVIKVRFRKRKILKPYDLLFIIFFKFN
jgi:hypothetical protein